MHHQSAAFQALPNVRLRQQVREALRALRDQERAPGCTVKVGSVFLLSGMAMGRLWVPPSAGSSWAALL